MDEALRRFHAQCRKFYSGLLEEVPEKVECLRRDILDQVLAEWRKQLDVRRAVFRDEMNQIVRAITDKLAREAPKKRSTK
jgi:hypothetical protein